MLEFSDLLVKDKIFTSSTRMIVHVGNVNRRLKRPIILILRARHSKVHFFVFGVKLKIDCVIKVDLCIGDCCMQRKFSTISTFYEYSIA